MFPITKVKCSQVSKSSQLNVKGELMGHHYRYFLLLLNRDKNRTNDDQTVCLIAERSRADWSSSRLSPLDSLLAL